MKMDKRTAIRTSKYEVIDAGKLKFDVKNYCKRNKIRQCDFYDEIGIGKSPLSNAVHTAENNASNIDFSRYEKCEEYGYIQKVFLIGICNYACLNIDDYIVKKKTNNKDKKSIKDVYDGMSQVEKDIMSIDVKVGGILNVLCKANGKFEDECLLQENRDESLSRYFLEVDKRVDALNEAVRTICKIEAQNMEYLKSIADGIQIMNDKYNKPSAYIRK